MAAKAARGLAPVTSLLSRDSDVSPAAARAGKTGRGSAAADVVAAGAAAARLLPPRSSAATSTGTSASTATSTKGRGCQSEMPNSTLGRRRAALCKRMCWQAPTCSSHCTPTTLLFCGAVFSALCIKGHRALYAACLASNTLRDICCEYSTLLFCV
jgi:hypothetical protein